jgi:hypothetical protein
MRAKLRDQGYRGRTSANGYCIDKEITEARMPTRYEQLGKLDGARKNCQLHREEPVPRVVTQSKSKSGGQEHKEMLELVGDARFRA